MNLLHKPNKVLICGASGTGKSTYYIRYVLNSHTHLYEKTFVFDHQGEFAFRTGLPVAETPEQLEEQYERGFVLFDPAEMFTSSVVDGWAFLCEWAFVKAKENPDQKSLIACDEMQAFSDNRDFPTEMQWVIEMGRKFGLDFAGAAQQVNLLPNRFRNQTTETVSFRNTDALVLKWMAGLGFDIEQLKTLEDGEFISRLNDGSEERGKIFLAEQEGESYAEDSDEPEEDEASASGDEHNQESVD